MKRITARVRHGRRQQHINLPPSGLKELGREYLITAELRNWQETESLAFRHAKYPIDYRRQQLVFTKIITTFQQFLAIKRKN